MPASGVDESRPHSAVIAGVQMAWSERACSGPVEQGLPLVLVHGFSGHRDDFIGVMPELARHRRVIAPDLRGHGDSHSPASVSEYSFDHVVKDLLGLLAHLGIPRCDLLGHSMGGMISLRFALAHPERIRSLIFLCSGPEVPTTLDREAFEKAAAIAEEHGMETLRKLSDGERPSSIRESWGERFWSHRARRFSAMSPAAYRGLGEAIFDSDSLVPRLWEVDLPALVLVGEEDADWREGAALFEAHLPRAIHRTIPGAEHHPHQENTEAWLEAVEEFLSAQAA
jgi:2-succinyl-6-hydroxy-2,4-cyclohexadiene-1-carboxylate synthase